MNATAPLSTMTTATALMCPTCHERWPMDLVTSYGVLTCQCGEYPVVAGIPILMPNQAHLVELIRGGYVHTSARNEALLQAFKPHFHTYSWLPWKVQKLIAKVQYLRYQNRADTALNGSIRNMMELYFGKGPIFDYFYYKFGTPRHLVGVAVASALPEGPVLDVGCGTGQITRAIADNHQTVGIDREFALLYMAKRIAPDAQFVCCDVNRGLPFPDKSFGSVFTSNALHFFNRPGDSYRDMLRVSQGPVAMTSLRHTGVKNNVPNHALSLEDYRAMVGDVPHSLRSDRTILEDYVGGDIDLMGMDDCSAEPLFTLIADPTMVMIHKAGKAQDIPGDDINPLYQRNSDGLYQLVTSKEFEKDNPLLTLPNLVGDLLLKDAVRMRHLGVLVDLPEGY